MNARPAGLALLLVVSSLEACSHTPGDAALRAGHPDAAANLYKSGAEAGRPDAAFKLGRLLDAGRADASRYGTAVSWYTRACELGDRAGCHNAGVAYHDGTSGAGKDLGEARAFYLKAAAKGFMQSQYNLGSLYADGDAAPADDVEGYKWMLIAEKAARACAPTPICDWVLRDPPGHRAKLRSRLPESAIREAERQAAAWTPAP